MLKSWKKGEIPFCEIASVAYPNKLGGPIVFNLTPRGMREYERCEAERQRRSREAALNPGGIDAGWLLFGPFVNGRPIFA